MDENGPDTLKIKNLDAKNELDYVQIMYDRAVQAYIAMPSYINRTAFIEANKRLIETRWAYRKGEELMKEFNLAHYGRFGSGIQYGSQDLHSL